MLLPKDKKKRIFLFKLCFGLGTFALLFILFEPKEIISTLKETNIYFFIFAFFSCSLVLLGRIYRWGIILRDLGIKVSFWKIAEMYIISYWFNTFMPGSVGGDVYKIYGLFKEGAQKIHSLATVFIERFTGLLAMITIAFVSIILFRDKLPVPGILLLSMGGIVAAIFVLLFSTRYVPKFCLVCRKYIKFTRKILTDEKIELISVAIEDIRKNKKMFIKSYLFGIVLQFIILVAYYFIGVSLVIDHQAHKVVPFVFFLMFFPVIEIITMVPISINGLGIRELLLVGFLKYANATGTFAISFSVINRLILIIFALIGGVLLLTKRSSKKETVDNS